MTSFPGEIHNFYYHIHHNKILTVFIKPFHDKSILLQDSSFTPTPEASTVKQVPKRMVLSSLTKSVNRIKTQRSQVRLHDI